MVNVLRFTFVVFLFAAIISSSNLSYAQSQGDDAVPVQEGARKKMDRHFKEVLEKLNLSIEQQQLLKENKLKHANQVKQLRASIKLAMQDLGEELKRKDLNMAKINELRAKFKVLRDQMDDERFQSILEVRKILNQEQFEKFIELTEKRHEKHKE